MKRLALAVLMVGLRADLSAARPEAAPPPLPP